MSVSADGYSTVEIDTGIVAEIPVKLRPSLLTGRVTDASTGKPLAGVLVKLVLPSAPVTTTETLTTTATIIATATVVATATESGAQRGFGKGLAAPRMVVTTTPARPTRTTARATRTPTKGTARRTATPTEEASEDTSEDEEEETPTETSTPVLPTATSTPTPKPVPPTGEGFVAMYTDENGTYTFKDVPPGSSLTFKMPGYKLVKMPIIDAT